VAETFARVRVLWQDRRCEELSWRSPTPKRSCAVTDNGFEVLTTLTVAGYLPPANGNNP
jgi:hypothetical protein